MSKQLQSETEKLAKTESAAKANKTVKTKRPPKAAEKMKPENAAEPEKVTDIDEVTDADVARILNTLRERGETVSTVESITAGMISARLADVPGCSDVLRRAFVTYCDEAKHEMVKVKNKTLKKHTAVSRQCAKQMAKGGARMAGAEACVSATGYAGPPEDPDDKSVGLVYLGCCYRGSTVVEEHRYSGQRNEVRLQAMNDALRLLLRVIN